jgi:glycosyltransferase-like protein LARGE
MVKRTEILPLFDERFINYGLNKVQWIETLRYLGFEYYVLSQSYAVDIPHGQLPSFE